MQSEVQANRLHKISPLFILFDNIKKLIFPIVLALFSTRGSSWELFALGFALIISLGAIVQYRFYRYWLEGDKIRVQEGILFRNVRQVPYKKIQNLNLVQSPLHRLFGVVKVQLESASGGKPEAVINVIDMQAVNELKRKINDEEEQQEEVAQPKDSIISLSFGEIVRYGMITNRGIVAVAIFFGFIMQFMDNQVERLVTNYISQFTHWIDGLVSSIEFENGWLYYTLITIIGVIAAIIALWLLSIVMALLKFHGFVLIKNKDKLQATMGLLTRLQATIPMTRIQTLTIHESLLHRWFKRIGITIETAGGVNNEQQGVSMKQVVPVAPNSMRDQLLNEIQSDVNWDAIDWQPINQKGWRRVLKVMVLIGLVITAPLALWSLYAYPAGFVLWLIYSVYYSKAYVKGAGYHINGQLVAFRDGVIFTKCTFVRLPKTQTIAVKESPFDRRHGMASLEVDTAGAMVGAHHINIPYLDLSVAIAIKDRISDNIKGTRFNW